MGSSCISGGAWASSPPARPGPLRCHVPHCTASESVHILLVIASAREAPRRWGARHVRCLFATLYLRSLALPRFSALPRARTTDARTHAHSSVRALPAQPAAPTAGAAAPAAGAAAAGSAARRRSTVRAAATMSVNTYTGAMVAVTGAPLAAAGSRRRQPPPLTTVLMLTGRCWRPPLPHVCPPTPRGRRLPLHLLQQPRHGGAPRAHQPRE